MKWLELVGFFVFLFVGCFLLAYGVVVSMIARCGARVKVVA